jgi:hypothetical protein
MAKLRKLGVIGQNAPTQKTKAVVASDFSNAGLIGFFERRYKKVFAVNNPEEQQLIFGNQINANWYGNDAAKGFFDNLAGVDGTLYIKSHVGNDGALFDAVTATSQLDDQQTVPEKILQLDSAYRGELEFSASGNRTGYTITNGSRFLTEVTGSSSTTTLIYLNSVIGIFVGDIVSVGLSGGDEYSKVSAIDEANKTITLTSALSGPPAATDEVNVLGFRLRLYRKSITGIITEVDTDLGEIYCTTESEVTDFFVQNIFATSSWIKASKLATTPTNIEETFPKDVTSVTYLASGVNGTSPTTVNQWAFDNAAFDGLPIRLIANVETAVDTIQKALELYCKSRDDTPLVFTTMLKDQDKLQLIEEGQNYQRSDDVFQVLLGSWIGVTDPFTTDPNAADRDIPSAGHIMALWIRTTSIKGIHYIPTKDVPILGINSVVDDSLGTITNRDRTDIAQAGVNLIQNITGIGFVLRNMFTPSTSTDFQFSNGLFMRNFIKISAQDSLQLSENTPNSNNQLKSDRDAVNNFMLGLWLNGSTGSVATGETFAQYQLADGSLSVFSDSVQVNIDPPVNTNASLQAGERNIEVYFAYPAPAGSIFIKVGILLPA